MSSSSKSDVPASENGNPPSDFPQARLPPPIYGQFFGLLEPPFDLTPNPRFLFLTARQREALSNLRYGLDCRKGFTLLLGDAGTGKTTLIQAALGDLGTSASTYVLVNNPTLSREEFYELLGREFGLSVEARTSKTQFLAELQRKAEDQFLSGGFTGIIIDEAQSLPDELLEEIRLLGNIETTTTKLLNIILSGQPELADRLNKPSLRQLKQRIALRCELKALTVDEAAAYISGRIRIAGGRPAEVFTREVVIALHKISGGIPRTLNVLCDNMLVGGFAAQVKPITMDVVEEVCRDFDLQHGPPAVQPPPTATPTSGVRSDTSTPAVSSPTTPPRVAEPNRPRAVRDHSSSSTRTPAAPDSRKDRSSDRMFSSFSAPKKSRFSFFK